MITSIQMSESGVHSCDSRSDANDCSKIDLDSKLSHDQMTITCEKSDKHQNRNRQRRPDMKLYVPPRAKCCVGNNMASSNCVDDKNAFDDSNEDVMKALGKISLSNSSHYHTPDDEQIESYSNIEDTNKEEPNDMQNSVSFLTKDCSHDYKASLSEIDDENSWDAIFDDNGDCIQPQILKEVGDVLSIGDTNKLKAKATRIDYSTFQPHEPEIDQTEFAHVLEVYDFPIELKTQDIITSLSVFNCCRDFDIKWVDDTHALVIFSNESTASEALKVNYPNIKVRPLSQGIRDSKIKAKRCSEFLRPYKQRPETSASLARRLVSGALGLKLNVTPEQRAAEKKKLQDAKERRRQAIKQGQDIWEGNVS